MKHCMLYWPWDYSGTSKKDLSLSKIQLLFSFMSRAHSFPWQEGFIHVWGLHASFISSHLSIFRGKRVLSSETKRRTQIGCARSHDSLAQWLGLQGGDTVDWPDINPMPAPEAEREDQGDCQPDEYYMELYEDKQFPKEDGGRAQV